MPFLLSRTDAALAEGVSSVMDAPSQIVGHPLWKLLARSVAEHRNWLEQVQIELTRIPAPTFHEAERAAFLAERLRELGLENVRSDEAGNVLAERPGRNPRWFA